MTHRAAIAPRVLTVGELMWDLHVEPPGTLELGEHLRRVPGGAAANVALSLASLGIAVAVAGIVGADALGRGLVCALANSGIDVRLIRESIGRTGLAFLERIHAEHERCVSYRPDTATPFATALPDTATPFATALPDTATPFATALPDDWLIPRGERTLLHIAAVTGDAVELAALAALAVEARARGAFITLDLNARPRAWRASLPLPAILPLLSAVDAIKASERDRDVVERAIETPLLEAVIRAGSATLLITRRAAPTLVRGPWGSLEIPPLAVTPVRSIGAGDAFSAGLASALLAHPPTEPLNAPFWTDAVSVAHSFAASRITTSW